MMLINPYRFASVASAPTFVDARSASLTRFIARPSYVQEGDFLVAFVGGFNPSTVTAPMGWTLQTQTTWQSGQYSSALLYKIATASEPVLYNFTGGTHNYGWVAAYRGASQIDVEGTIAEKSGVSMSFTGIASSAGSKLLACLHDRDNVSLTAPSGMTSRVDSASGGSLWRVALADLDDANSDNRVWSAGSSSFFACGILVSIKA